MAACKPARQCALIFPTGKRCGSPALRGQSHCYHHAANHRAYTRDRLLCERLSPLREKLDTMGTSELLNFLHGKLSALPRTMTRFPEISFALTYTLDRLEEENTMESRSCSFPQQNHELIPGFSLNPIEPGTYR